MKTYEAHIKSAAPATFSRQHNADKESGESHDAYEKRTWREKLTFADNNIDAIINPMAFKFAISSAARKRGEKIAGKGNKTWAKLFDSGILIMQAVPLGVTRETVAGLSISVNADGVRGGGKRVMRTFPIVRQWEGKLVIHVLDDEITGDILRKYVDEAGKFIGIGQFRPENLGTNGRWEVVGFKEI